MPVTDAQAAALRALLAADEDLYRSLSANLDSAAADKSYRALITAALGLAVERRFGTNYDPAEIVVFIAHARARSDTAASRLDPDTCERVVRTALGAGIVPGWDTKAITSAELLLGGLAADAGYTAAALDEFLAAARKLAAQLLT